MMKKVIFILALSVLLGQATGFAQSPSELVDGMVKNELAAAKNDHSYWMYRDSQSHAGVTKVREVVETPEGEIGRLLSVNGKAPSPDEKKKNEQEIHRLLTDPSYRKQQQEKAEQDERKATQLLTMLPKAFVYQEIRRDGDLINLSFRPNPAFVAPTREAKVFHAMAGTLLIDARQMRLARLSGRLMNNVNFGWGILGKLKKGGTFEVDQTDIGGAHWELSKLDVHISGHALFFATIKEQQNEMRSGFQEVPPGTTLAKAVELLNQASASAAGN